MNDVGANCVRPFISHVRPHPTRKPNRLKGYDYSHAGAYFLTICTKDRKNLFADFIVGANCVRPLTLTKIGEVVEEETSLLGSIYPNVKLDAFVIMPNHVHMILVIYDDTNSAGNGRTQCAPTERAAAESGRGKRECAASESGSGKRENTDISVSRVIKQWKGIISKKIGFSPWQKSFHDHIVRNEQDYIRIAEYIENNPYTWEKDCFYSK